MIAKAGYLGLFLLSFFVLSGAGPVIDRDDLVVPVRAPKTVIPGQFETFILELSNDFTYPLNFTVSVDKPESWRFLSKVDNVHLEPGETKSVIFLMDIDRACEIGQKDIRFTFYDKQHDVRIEEVVTTTVENVHEVHARAIRTPNHLMGGQEFEVEFIVRNLGNCYENITVTSEKGVVSKSSFIMPPNSTQYVKVKQTVPELTQAGYIASGISLVTEYAEQPIRERVSLKAYPKTTSRSDRYNRFPVDISLIYFGAKNARPYEGSLQFEAIGNGYLDQNQRHRLNFVARAPNRFSIARVGNFDQYSFDYVWKKDRDTETRIKLGDFSYNLTPVTEMFRWARGIEVSHKTGKWEVGAFYNTPRFYSEIKNQYASYVKYSPLKFWEVQLSGMQKNYTIDGSPATLGSFRNQFRFDNHLVVAEYSRGSRNGLSGSAANLEFTGRFKGFSYSSQNIYAGKDYPGYYTNSLFTNSTLRYRLGKWGANVGFAYNDANPAQDTILTISPYSMNTTAGITHHFSSKLRLMVNYIHRVKEDRLPTRKFAYRENAIRYMLAYKDEFWNVMLDGETAETENLLIINDRNTANTYNIRARIDREVLPTLTIGGFSQYLYTNRYDLERRAYLFYGGNIAYRPMPNIRLRGSYRNNYLIDEYNSDRTLLDFEVSANYKDHRLSINTSHAIVRNTTDRKDFFISARYTYHLNAPISKKEGLYSLAGLLKSTNKTDAGGVIVNIGGQSVITDEYGRFVVNDLPPGIHYLHIDKGSMDVGLVTAVETPLEVEVFPKKGNYISIDVVRSASIEGNVKHIIQRQPGEDRENPPLRIIKASNGDREMLTYTDADGNFSFGGLLPGEWTIRIVEDKGTQRKWKIARNNIQVNVASAETKKVRFEISKKERKIKFSQQSVDLKISN